MKIFPLRFAGLALLAAGLILVLGWQGAGASFSPSSMRGAGALAGAGSQVRAVAAAAVGEYGEGVNSLAFAVESTGRVHVLWTGQLNPHFESFAFYSSSADGARWSPFRILNYTNSYDPQIVVDDTRHRAHLMYRSNEEGIIHHTVANGVVSAPTVVDPGPSVLSPRLAIDPTTGYAYCVWQQGYMYKENAVTWSWRLRLQYARWDGSRWSAQRRIVNSEDTYNPAIAVAPGGRVMVAWLQNWAESRPKSGADPGQTTIPRTAYAADGVNFSLRQGVAGGYPAPETDDDFVLAYSPHDDRFYMLTDHLMWPGHSIVYRYVWNGSWSAPLNISKNGTDWAVPRYVGGAQSPAFSYYVYSYAGLKSRKESGGTLGPAQDVIAQVAAKGYTTSGATFFLDRSGILHLAFVGTKDGASGLYYVRMGAP